MSQRNDMETCLKGHFLIAMPSLADPNFVRTVTYLCEHSEEGAVGLVINRVHPELTIQALFKELDLESASRVNSLPIHLGGPVHSDQIFVLHGPPFGWNSCTPVTPSIALSNSKDLLESIAKEQGPEFFMITLGCAGWGPGQLEAEILANTWLSCPADEKIVFETPPEKQWEEAAGLMGIDLRLFTGFAGHA